MVVFRANTPGASWLRAMFKYYARKYHCAVVYYPDALRALGHHSGVVERKFEVAQQLITNQVVEYRAMNPEVNHNAATTLITKQFVKRLYREGRV